MEISNIILKAAADSAPDELIENAGSYRVLELNTREGSASAKLQKTNVRNQKVEIFFKPFKDETWNELFDIFSAKSVHFGNLLCQKYSEDFESIVIKKIEEVSTESDFLKYFINGREQEQLCEVSLALLKKVFVRIEESPWELLLLFGRGRDESILEIHERRRKEQKKNSTADVKEEENSKSELESLDAASVQDFWNHGRDLNNLSYKIKADELPAATIKRLDAIPLLGIEEHIEAKVEAAYEKIARLAQSYGLSF